MFKSSSYRSSRPGYDHAGSREQEQPFFTPQVPKGVQTKKEGSFFQPKLSIGQPGDKFEKEADKVADKVVNKKEMDKEPAIQRQEISSIQRLATPMEDENFATNDERMKRDREIREKPGIQRMCSHCEEEKKKQGVQKKDAPKEDEKDKSGKTVHRKESSSPGVASASLSNRIGNSHGKGAPLPASTLSEMQSSFGADFSNVNIHTDSEAVQMNRELGAQAFTHGSDVYFNSGKFDPGTSGGKHLLAHELTHVVQQGEAGAGSIQRSCNKDAAAAGASGCTPLSSDPAGEKILFKINCDELANPSQRAKLSAFADSMTDTDSVNVHGFASVDGPPDFNEKLSCARAKTVADILKDKGIPDNRVNTFQHGPTAGPASAERSVILEMASGINKPPTPQLTADSPLTLTNGCNDTTCDIDWKLSRKSGRTGGFILQDITITFLVQDCNGQTVTFPVSSPLHYFEAWNVFPNSTNIDPADGSTDTFDFKVTPPPGKRFACTTGRAVYSAVAHYHDNVAVLPGHMQRFNPATVANNLRSSLTDPALGGNISRSVPHNFAFHWNCCPCPANPGPSTSAIDSRTP
jgi:hypothetical protein